MIAFFRETQINPPMSRQMTLSTDPIYSKKRFFIMFKMHLLSQYYSSSLLLMLLLLLQLLRLLFSYPRF